VAQRFLAPNLSPDASKSQNSLLNSLIAGKSSGDGRDQHCNASQAVRRSEKLSPILAERAANGGLLRSSHQSPGSDFAHSQSEIAKSLRRTFEKLPFLGDCARRPGSICTAWPSLQCNSPNSPPWPRARVGNAEPALPSRPGSRIPVFLY
jgi:hypothetical protein